MSEVNENDFIFADNIQWISEEIWRNPERMEFEKLCTGHNYNTRRGVTF